MRNVFLYTVTAAALLAAPAMAQDPSNVYGAVSYSQVEADGVDLGAVTGRLGYKINPNFAVEGEASFGVADDDLTIGAVTANVEHEYDAAVYAVGILPVTPNFELFGRLGYGTTEIEASAAGVSASDSGESWNYGVGANYFIDDRNGIRADWTRRDFTNDGGEADVWSLGYVRKF
jgi:outer membrane immunogenic protein